MSSGLYSNATAMRLPRSYAGRIGIFFCRSETLEQPILQNSSPGRDTPALFRKRFKDIYNRQISGAVNRRLGMSRQGP